MKTSIACEAALLGETARFLTALKTVERAITEPTLRRTAEKTLRATARLLLLAADRLHYTPELSRAIRTIQDNHPRHNLN